MNLTVAVVLGALGGLDRTAFGQTLLSHPAVIAALAGWAVHAPREGAWLGIGLALLSTPHVPVGRERLRDWPSAAVAACVGAARRDEPWAWGTALALALGVAWGGGWAVAGVRRLAERAIEGLRARLAQGDLELGRLERVHLACGALEALRGALVASMGALGIWLLLPAMESALAPPERTALSAFWRVAPLVGLPLALRIRAAGVRRRWLWPGVALGMAAAWVWGGAT